MVLIDLRRAFDSLCHWTLLSKLYLEQSLTKGSIVISRIENNAGYFFVGAPYAKPWVPQSSILDPMLFSLYMNDLPGVTKFTNIESYVDDLSSSAQDIHSCLHQSSQDLELW